MKVIVLDINCLLQILPRKAPKRWLYDLILQGKVSLALSSEIVLEYQEILEQRTNAIVAQNVVKALAAGAGRHGMGSHSITRIYSCLCQGIRYNS